MKTLRIACCLLAALPAVLHAQSPATLRATCGGVGAEERRSLAEAGAHASLEVLFVSAKRGAYQSGARLRIADAAGATVLDVVAEGPICQVQAPPGRYRVRGELQGHRAEKAVRVAAGARAKATLAFPDEPHDGVTATEEEKRQGRDPR